MDVTTKQKLEDFIKESAKGSVMEAFAEYRKEQEAKSAEERKTFELSLANLSRKSVEDAKPENKGWVPRASVARGRRRGATRRSPASTPRSMAWTMPS
jgi:hypothetical protein